MKKTIVAVAALAILCLAQAAEFNGTTYRLEHAQIEVSRPVNGNGFNLTLHQKAESIALFASDGNETKINSSYSFWRGEHIYRITFSGNISGKLVYTMPFRGQQFALPLRESGPVRVILPPGYTTGDRILGIARPDPDDVKVDQNGTVLTWFSPSGLMIEVDFYSTNAPWALKKIFAFLAAVGAILVAEYYASMKRLRAISRETEKRA